MSESVFSLFDGELDEFWLTGVNVHVERMNVTGFWIGFDLPSGKRVMLNTGVYRGTWFFNVEEDGGESCCVQRPRKSSIPEEIKSNRNASAALIEVLKKFVANEEKSDDPYSYRGDLVREAHEALRLAGVAQ